MASCPLKLVLRFLFLVGMFFLISAYVYLIFAGNNVPWWVYGAVVLLILVGAYSTITKVRRRISEPNGVMEVKR